MAIERGISVTLGLGKRKPGAMGGESLGGIGGAEDDDMGGMDPKVDAAQAIIDAVRSKDATALSEALSTHYDLCAAKSDMGESYEEDRESSA